MTTDPVELQIEDDSWNVIQLEQLANIAVRSTLNLLGGNPDNFEVSLLACDDRRIGELNQTFRGKPDATNVLSWPSEDLRPDTPGKSPLLPLADISGAVHELGDMAISFETCEREATQQKKKFDQHVTHLIVHGTLHLLGYDHIRDKDADLMEALETKILGNLGIEDPYGQ